MQRAALRPLQKGAGWALFTSPIATSSSGNKNNIKGFVSSHTRNVSSFTHANGSGLVRRTTTNSSTNVSIVHRNWRGAAVGSQRRFASSSHGSNAGPGVSVYSRAVLLFCSPFLLFRGQKDRRVCCCASALCQASTSNGADVSGPCSSQTFRFSGYHILF